MDDCRLRSFIYQLASIVLYGLIIYTAVVAITDPLGVSIRNAYIQAGRTTGLESDVKTTVWIVYASIFAILLFLLRLYLSMEVFDSHEYYFHEYIEPLRPSIRITEWSIRLLIMCYLLAALKFGFDKVNITCLKFISIVSFNHISIGIPEHIPCITALRSIMLFLTIFFILFIIWDIAMIGPMIKNKKFVKFSLRFFLPHLMGFSLWAMLTYLFWSKDTLYDKPMLFGIYASILIAIQIVLVGASLIVGKKGTGLFSIRNIGFFGEGSLFYYFGQHACGKLKFLFSGLECSVANHKPQAKISDIYNIRDYESAMLQDPQYQEAQDVLINEILEIPKNHPIRILEIGGGSGIFTEKLALSLTNANITVIEPDEEWLSALKLRTSRFSNINSKFDVIEKYTNSFYDICCASFALHHIPYENQLESIDKIYNLLTPGGYFIILDKFIPDFNHEYERQVSLKTYHGYFMSWKKLNKIPHGETFEVISLRSNLKQSGDYKFSINIFENKINEYFALISDKKIAPLVIEAGIMENIIGNLEENGFHVDGSDIKEIQRNLHSDNWGIYILTLRKKSITIN